MNFAHEAGGPRSCVCLRMPPCASAWVRGVKRPRPLLRCPPARWSPHGEGLCYVSFRLLGWPPFACERPPFCFFLTLDSPSSGPARAAAARAAARAAASFAASAAFCRSRSSRHSEYRS